MLLFVAGLAGILFLGLTAQPTSTVVLLPDADGIAGAVDIRTESDRQSLNVAYASATNNARGVFVTQSENAESVRARYAQTLAAIPKVSVSFVLVFEFGSAVDIAPAFQPVLAQLRAAVTDYPSPEITVIGHTDRVGSDAVNDALARKRAETVRTRLTQRGIAAENIVAVGRGKREPIVPTADGVAEPLNRRVEIVVR